MGSFSNVEEWLKDRNPDLRPWLFDEVNKRLKARGLRVAANQTLQEDASIKTFPFGSSTFPQEKLTGLLEDPFSTPFVGYSLLVEFLRQPGGRLLRGKRQETRKFRVSFERDRVEMIRRLQNLPEDAWAYMDEDSERTVKKNHQCLDLLKNLSREWRPELYDVTLLSRLSFVPWVIFDWLPMRIRTWPTEKMKESLQRKKAMRAHYRRHYLNPFTNPKDDPLYPLLLEEEKALPQEEQRKILANTFRTISKKSVNRNFKEMGIDKKAEPLRQDFWRQLLPPLCDYLIFLQGATRIPESSYNRADTEASQILNARYPDRWSHSPSSVRRVKYSVTRR